MNSRWQKTLLVILLHSLQDLSHIFCEAAEGSCDGKIWDVNEKQQKLKVEFPLGIVIDAPECGLEHNVGTWKANGKITIPQSSDFNPGVDIQAKTRVCRIDLTQCKEQTLTPSYCICKSNKSHVYELEIHQKPIGRFSMNEVKVIYRGCDFVKSNNTISHKLGSLPKIRYYEATFKKDGINQGILKKTQKLTANSGVNITFCVSTNFKKKNLTFYLNGEKKELMEMNCTSKTFDPPMTVEFKYSEGGCKSSKIFSIELLSVPSQENEPDKTDESVNPAFVVVGILGALVVVFGLCFYAIRQSRRGQQVNLEPRPDEAAGSPKETPKETLGQETGVASSVHKSSEAPETSSFSKNSAPAKGSETAPPKVPGQVSDGASSKATTQKST